LGAGATARPATHLDRVRYSGGGARLRVSYHMGPSAEEAATLHTLGFFERLVELAGAPSVEAQLTSRSWAGDPRSVIELWWSGAS
jgi:hypothetical protein